MRSLEDFQSVIAKVLVLLAVLHVPVLTGLAAMLDRPVTLAFALSAAMAALPAIWLLQGYPSRLVAQALAPALVGHTAILVWIFAGHAWQLEMHFYFFAVLAMLAGFCQLDVLIVAMAVIAVQHLATNWVLPSLLYPGGSDTRRVLVHVWFVVVEGLMLAVIGTIIKSAFERARRLEAASLAAQEDLEATRLALEKALAASGGDVERLQGSLTELQHRIGERLDGLLGASRTLASNARDLGGAAETVSTKAAATIASASEATGHIEEVADVGRRFVKIFADIAAETAGSTTLTEAAVAQVDVTRRTIEELAGMSADIDRASKVIGTIATQTNLLALNATIEAARAGVEGRGFVVVASEVKALAASTGKAASDIGCRIEAIQSYVQETVQAIHAIARGIGALDASSTKVSRAVAAQGEAAGRVASVSQATSRTAERVAEAVGAIDLLAEGAKSSAVAVEGAALDIAAQAAAIRTELGAFAAQIAA